MFSYIWPLALLVLSNTAYQICAKGVPSGMHPLAALTITYVIGALTSGVLYHVLTKNGNLLREYGQLNWAPLVMGVVVVGLEVSCIYAYQAGWQVNSLPVVQSAFLAITLLAVGALLYQEPLTANKLIGVVICLVGLWFINH